MTDSQIISADQWTVTGWDANHRRSWYTIVRASTVDNAKRVAWSHLARPKWVSVHTLTAELTSVRTDLLLREMIRSGYAREVHREQWRQEADDLSERNRVALAHMIQKPGDGQ
jgi:hypothetical protein